MNKTGRKSFKEELQLFQRYSELSVPYFRFLRDCMEGESKEDRKWASERLEKAFVKMLPQETDITSGGIPLFLPAEIIMKNGIDTSSESETDSEGQPQV